MKLIIVLIVFLHIISCSVRKNNRSVVVLNRDYVISNAKDKDINIDYHNPDSVVGMIHLNNKYSIYFTQGSREYKVFNSLLNNDSIIKILFYDTTSNRTTLIYKEEQEDQNMASISYITGNTKDRFGIEDRFFSLSMNVPDIKNKEEEKMMLDFFKSITPR